MISQMNCNEKNISLLIVHPHSLEFYCDEKTILASFFCIFGY